MTMCWMSDATHGIFLASRIACSAPVADRPRHHAGAQIGKVDKNARRSVCTSP
jgi:hypothetical protein